jgi:hypothetical protein
MTPTATSAARRRMNSPWTTCAETRAGINDASGGDGDGEKRRRY